MLKRSIYRLVKIVTILTTVQYSIVLVQVIVSVVYMLFRWSMVEVILSAHAK